MNIRRRDFITLLGGATAAWPLAARAQQATRTLIGYLSNGTPAGDAAVIAGFRKGLNEMGFAETRNVAIEFRWAQNDYSRLPALAADLVRSRMAVIAAVGTAAPLAVKALTSTIPVVFDTARDPVQSGIVTSLNRPGSNITGVNFINSEHGPKRLGLLHMLLPRATHFAALINPSTPQARRDGQLADLRAAAAAIGSEIEAVYAGTNAEIDAAFASLGPKRAEALVISPQFLFTARRAQILGLAARHAVPVIYGFRDDVESGGLMSYGADQSDPPRQLGIYTGRILKGENPADLPVMRSTKFELVINLQTAKLLGIEVPPTLLSIADEVIE